MPSGIWPACELVTNAAPETSAPPPQFQPEQEGRLSGNLRFRFGLLLALALLPWLLFTAIEEYSDLHETRLSEARTLDLIAQTAVRDVGLILDSGVLAIEAAPRLIANEGCEVAAQMMLSRLRVYSAVVVQNEEGEVTCQSTIGEGAPNIDNAGEFSVLTGFRLEAIGPPNPEGSEQIVLQKYQADTGEIFSLILPSEIGMENVLDATIGTRSVLNVAKPGGEIIVGTNITFAEQAVLQPNLTSRDIVFIDWNTSEGQARRIAASYLSDLDVYVGVVRDRNPRDIFRLINPYTNVGLPIVVWVVGFALIWLGTQSMILRPLRKVRTATRQFAKGDMQKRVRLSGAAADEVHGLGRAFNRMAHIIEDREARLADNLDEKDALMREIHHRVKNNLQIIISLLNMQERKAESEEALSAISESRTRINAIAAVHHGLYESPDLRGVSVGPFVSRLISTLSDSLDVEEQGITIRQSVIDCRLPADSAIPVALFIVEGVSNAAKHGVARGGEINIEIDEPIAGSQDENPDTEQGEKPQEKDASDPRTYGLRISIRDNGKGVGDPANMRGIGTRLMKGFARQLGGELKFSDNQPGLIADLLIPVKAVSEQPFQVSRKQAERRSRRG